MQHFGIIELALTAAGALAFYIWQMRSLNRDVAARKAREAEQARDIKAQTE